ncbi:restriction endonuclease subunit S [Chryseobacterium sp. POL2]|uniref:restriction endonuclease subunit S n=1 Tax=Chryseobacterium sp. POL2 TaxID=2713414 RepID=UPI0013E0FF20|nr:restriction endonuclease subunit S [Chryseobacterium sp. POL2]QIG88879.1 restriction endonuclease subunit S [Chryseobacterium sp. POL2]
MSYKILGDYIRKVDNKNRDMKVLNLQGLSMTKEFRKSTSNIVGTDLSKYKIVKQGQFCCDFMSVIRVHKLPVVLNNLGEDVIISPAYVVFEVIDENLLLPEYLMLWFRRTEFDRYADFRCDSSIRGGFQWEELCEVELPVPSIEKQREIVAQYQAVENKIKVNEQICEQLEATAQTLYKQWFVDFEFPVTDTEALEVSDGVASSASATGYKSSGGAMVYNQELEKEIPEGWEVGLLSDLITVKYGKDYKHLSKGDIPLYGSGGIMSYVNEVLYNKPSVLIPRKGSLNNILYVKTPFWSVDTMFYTIPKIDNTLIYVFNVLSKMDFNSLNVGSAVPSMTTEYLNSMQILIPENNVLKAFDFELNQLEDYKISVNTQNQKLTRLQSLLLSRLARLEG